MDCPRCDGPLASYTLDGTRAVVCEACGFVDVPTDLHPTRDDSETWEEALRRFRDRHRAPDETETVVVTVGDATYRVAPGVRERYEGLTEKQRAIIRELLAEETPTEPGRTREEIGDAAGAHRSYVSEVVKEYGGIAAALAAGEREG